MGASFPTRRELELAKARAQLHGAPMRPLDVTVPMVIGGMLGAVGYALFTRWDGRIATVSVEAAMFIVLGWLVVWLCVGTPTMRGMHERIHRRLAHLRMCLCCGYELEGIPAESDGCTVCPECGAAWRLTESSP